MTPAELQAFEQRVADAFNAGRIRAPVHLAGGNEEQLIEVFKNIGPRDWVCGAWRMHLHCLLKGVPEKRLFADILKGRSITLTYPKQRIITSAMVAGIMPIATGIAWATKRRGGAEKVWCFIGDMTATAGVAFECVNYSLGQDLPIRFVVEDNGLSVFTPTQKTWGASRPAGRTFTYKYELTWPHYGTGKRVEL